MWHALFTWGIGIMTVVQGIDLKYGLIATCCYHPFHMWAPCKRRLKSALTGYSAVHCPLSMRRQDLDARTESCCNVVSVGVTKQIRLRYLGAETGPWQHQP
ncbi:hypothetical protein ASPVEDRAFT_675068 [Aspergillus versicolor CBS 583.65]|uniref:Secreted protein n=1 Tax=Aspergillus versicolor CBS 583.65 TaxID=1036611 RepID=A0A1L9PLS2_ASPVE|nr:uncharacterized protein ASPVEDRAFT_675068 [Aspergillus versicolor CBS 583.65]OJJ02443.1 hypothetical protein ASPVEDRAFT_675068 [Aspergillus versicolor CBS 583.65]